MDWEVFRDKEFLYDWRVEAINYDGDGEIYCTAFSGPLAEERARSYAAWRNGGA